jgi:uroporphyrin-III C-methyltransferase/precorrin-2 dehydrogenase/sirohydrochlorin ferrochelatase
MNAVSPRNSAALDSDLAYFPIFLGLRGRVALLIGDGDAALAKLDLLRRAGASVRTVAGDALQAEDFDAAVLAIDASGDLEVNRRAVGLARAARVPINVVDRPALCDFIMPSILDRSPVIVAVSTGGLAPAIARLIRQRLETAIPSGIGGLAAIAARIRHAAMERLPSACQRMRFWEALFDGAAAGLIADGRHDDAAVAAEALLAELSAAPETGSLSTVQVASEDPELLTLRAARQIRMADVILHDPLISSAVIDLARRDAIKRAVSADRAKTMLRFYARQGRSCVYLVSGAVSAASAAA